MTLNLNICLLNKPFKEHNQEECCSWLPLGMMAKALNLKRIVFILPPTMRTILLAFLQRQLVTTLETVMDSKSIIGLNLIKGPTQLILAPQAIVF